MSKPQSAGISKKGPGQKVKKPDYFAETEKAVKLRIRVNDFDLEQEKTRLVWVPKSQLADDGRPGEWITEQKVQEFYSRNRSMSQVSVTWEDSTGKKFSTSSTAKEIEQAKKAAESFKKGVNSYNALMAEAKALGIKGIRVGLKRKTLERKIAEHKNKKK